MKIETTPLQDLLLITPTVHGDARGWFFESFHRDKLAAAGLPIEVAQANVSRSRRGVLRGLHFQQPNPQGKLVYVLEGEVFDVGVDLRTDSAQRGRWHGEILSAENHRMLYLPPGYAHGFQVLSDYATFCYFCTTAYDPTADRALRHDDPDIGIRWRDTGTAAELSAKDRAAPSLRELDAQGLGGAG